MDLEQATRVDGDDGRYVAQLSDAWELATGAAHLCCSPSPGRSP